MTMNGAVLPVLALYIVAAEEQGVPPEKLAGTIQNDILKEFMVRNTYIYPPEAHRCASSPTSSPTPRRICRNSIRSRFPAITCRRPARRRISSSPIRSPTASNMCAPASRPGLTIDRFAPRLSFFWAIGMNFFMEVAKLRAARMLWAKLMQPFEPKDPRSLSLRTHCQTSGWSLAAQDVFNNVVRTCIEAMAATQGADPVAAHQRARRGAGAADRFFRPHRAQHADRAAAARAARPASIDPWGGSFYVERLTHELARKAWRPHPRRSKNSAAWPRRSRPACPSCASRRPPPRPRRASIPARKR